MQMFLLLSQQLERKMPQKWRLNSTYIARNGVFAHYSCATALALNRDIVT